MWRPQGPISFGGLKGQKLLAQGNALGKNDFKKTTPYKGKSILTS